MIDAKDLYSLCLNGTVQELKEAIEAGADVNARSVSGLFGETPLMGAVFGYGEDMEKLKLLLDAGADPNATDSAGRTALMCSPGDREVAKLLLDAGADINARDRNERTVLMTWSFPAALDLLLEAGADVNARSVGGMTPLMYAAMNNLGSLSAPALKTLIDAGADIHAKEDSGEYEGMTALLWAANRGAPESIDVLLKAGADLNAKDKKGLTALMHAAMQNRNPKVVRRLVAAGVDVDARTKDGRTALMRGARHSECPSIINALLEAGANPNARDKKGNGPLDYMRKNRYLRDTEAMGRLEEAIRQSGGVVPEPAPEDQEAPKIKPFPYDEFGPVLMEELKALFSRFIEQNRGERPYAFALVPWKRSVKNAAGAVSRLEFYFLTANGDTFAGFESKGVGTAEEFQARVKELAARREEKGLPLEKESKRLRREVFKTNEYPMAFYYYYHSEEWTNDAFTDEDFPKSNRIIGNYILENEADFLDDIGDCNDAFIELETEFLNFLIGCLKRLRAEGYFESVYPDRIFVNFEVWEHYTEEEELCLFEALNSPEEAKLYARFLYG